MAKAKRSHQEIRDTKAIALDGIFGHIRNVRGRVKVNNLYTMVSDIWNSEIYFLRDLAAACPADIRIEPVKHVGTFGIAIGKNNLTVRETVLGGLLGGVNYRGVPTTIKPTIKMAQCKKVPKMFTQFGDTVAVYRKDFKGRPSKYLQVTATGNYLFEAVK